MLNLATKLRKEFSMVKIYGYLLSIITLIFIFNSQCYSGQKKEQKKEQIDAITNISVIENNINSLLSEADKYIENYKKDKNIKNLDSANESTTEAYNKIYREAAKSSEISVDADRLRKDFQMDKATYLAYQIRDKKITLLGSSLLPSICEKFYEIGDIYKDAGDITKAKKVFRYIIIKFTTYEFKSCVKQAEFALEDLKDGK